MKIRSIILSLSMFIALTASAATPQIPYLGSGVLTFGAFNESLGTITVTDPNGVNMPGTLSTDGGRTQLRFFLDPDTTYSAQWTWPQYTFSWQAVTLVAENDRGPSSDTEGWSASKEMPSNQIGIQITCEYHLDEDLPFGAHIIVWNVTPICVVERPPIDPNQPDLALDIGGN